MSDRDGMVVVRRAEELWRVSTRRDFLKVLAVGGIILVLPSLFSACSDDDGITAPIEPLPLDLSTDTGLLNYLFVLEQLEAAFYEAVVTSTTFGGMTAEQREVFTDLRNHEVAHRELLRAVLGSAAIGDLSFNRTIVGNAISSGANILESAEAFEDLGVSAYDGVGKYLQDANNLLLAAKIVSVEGRHAAAIRDLREGLNLAGTPANTRFAGDDVVGAQGLDVKREPSAALTRVGDTGFVSTGIAIDSQPTLAQSSADVTAVLDFALTLEIFENEFYKAVLGTSASAAQNATFATVRALIPATMVTVFQQIQKHEAAHVAFLLAAGAPNSLGLTADSFDFTGNRGSGTPGPFARAATELPFLLALAQAIEDTGVRAYKGQVGALSADRAMLESALRIHSVEARHASKLRRLRRAGGASSVKYSGAVSGGGSAAAGTGNITPAPDAAVIAAFGAIYDGEDDTSQGGVTITSLNNLPSAFDANAASEAFDEPLTKAQVIAIVQPFVVKGLG